MNNLKEEKAITLGHLMKYVLNDVSPFRGFYTLVLVVSLSISTLLSIRLDNYYGLLPFTQTMSLATQQIRLMNDVMIMALMLCCITAIALYFLRGVSAKTKNFFRKNEKNSQTMHELPSSHNRKLILLIGGIFFLLFPFLWIEHFGFSDAGNTRLTQFTLSKNIIILNICYIMSILGIFFLFIFAITSFEVRKYIM